MTELLAPPEEDDTTLEEVRAELATLMNGRRLETQPDGMLLDLDNGEVINPKTGEVLDTYAESGLPEFLETEDDVGRVLQKIFDIDIQAAGCDLAVKLYTDNMAKVKARHTNKANWLRMKYRTQLESFVDQVIPPNAKTKSIQYGFGKIGRKKVQKVWGLKKDVPKGTKTALETPGTREYELVRTVHAELNPDGENPLPSEDKTVYRFLKSKLTDAEMARLLELAPDLFEETGGHEEVYLETGATSITVLTRGDKAAQGILPGKPDAPLAIAAAPAKSLEELLEEEEGDEDADGWE